MPYTTTGVELFYCGGPKFRDSLRAGGNLAHKLLSCYLIRGYAETCAAAGCGVLWRISLPYLVWSRGRAKGAIQAESCNPGIGYNVDDSYLARNFSLLNVSRI